MKAEKTCAISGIEVYSTEAIYTRKIYLMSASSIKTEDMNGMFNMGLNRQKSELKNTPRLNFQTDTLSRKLQSLMVFNM